MPPIEHVLPILLFAVFLPALLAAALMAGACWLGRQHDAIPYIGSAIAVAAGLALGNYLRDDLIPLTPGGQGWEWLGRVALAALGIGIIARVPRVPAGLGWGLRGMASAHAGWLLTPRDLREEYVWASLLLGAVIFAEWAVLEVVGRLDPAGLVPLVLVPAAMASALLLVSAGSARFAEVAFVLIGVLLGVFTIALLMRSESSGVAPAVAVILPALLLTAWHTTFSEVPKASFALAALSPLCLAPSLWSAWQRYQKKGLWAVQLVLMLLLPAAAILLAVQNGSLDLSAE